jgi:hypothetical protein
MMHIRARFRDHQRQNNSKREKHDQRFNPSFHGGLHSIEAAARQWIAVLFMVSFSLTLFNRILK